MNIIKINDHQFFLKSLALKFSNESNNFFLKYLIPKNSSLSYFGM